jgi:hypothetical protein
MGANELRLKSTKFGLLVACHASQRRSTKEKKKTKVAQGNPRLAFCYASILGLGGLSSD